VDIFCPLPHHYTENPEAVQAARAAGCEIWTYTALCQNGYSPKWQADHGIIEHRLIQGAINYSIGATGYLYWAVDCWGSKKAVSDDPWTSLEIAVKLGIRYDENGEEVGDEALQYAAQEGKKVFEATVSFHGDGVLCYPGKDAGLSYPAPSVRMKAIRDGFADYELLKLLERMGGGEAAKALARSVGRDFRDWAKNPEDMQKFRTRLIDELERRANGQ
jgi:hypothetical protein